MADLAKLKIGDFVLDPSRNVLIGGEGEIALEPKVVDVLMTLAARPGVVLTRDELIDAVWKTEFGADERLTRTISQLRKAFGDERGAERFIETVPKRGYRLVAAVEPLDETNAPFTARAESATPPSPATPVASREIAERVPSRAWRTWQAAAAAGVLAVLAVAGIAATGWRNPEAGRLPALVAVLPFDDLSPQQQGKGFAEGLTEEILYALSKSSDIAVVARSSSFKFTTAQADEAVKALEATHLVEGTVRREGETVRVGVIVKDTRSQAAIWSETFARPAGQILQVQDDIAWRVADALGARLTRSIAAPDVDAETYARYLRARDLLRLRRDNAVEEFEAVVARAPRFARAWAGLAFARQLRAGWRQEQTGLWPPELIVATQQAIDRTLDLEPENGEALAILGLRTQGQGRLTEAEAFYNRALAAEPNSANVLNSRYIFFTAVGRRRAAAEDVSRAYSLDRLSPSFAGNLGDELVAAGRFAAAEAMLEDGRIGGPEWDGTYIFDIKRDLLAYKGDWNALVRYMSEPQFVEPALHAEMYALIGETASALAEKKPIDRAYFRRRWTGVTAGHTYRRLAAIQYLSYLGDIEGAMAHLEAVLTGPDRWHELPNAFLPFAAPLRKDRRFIALMDSFGLWDYWRTSGQWPDFCSEPGLPYDCKLEAERAKAGR